MPYEFRECPTFSWSHSRRTTFQECPRKYYYHYYASHNGWEATAPEGARLAYRLKNLTSLPLEIGAAIHEAASTAIHAVRSGDKAPTAEMLYSTARNRLNKAWKESQYRPEWERSPKWRRMFHEFYYDTGIGEDKIAGAKDRIMKCLGNLLASVSFREAIASPHCEIKNVEEFATFDIDGTDIHAVPDLVYRRGDGAWMVVDWKSGHAQNENAGQGSVYALYVRQRHGVEAPNIVVRIEQLLHGVSQDHSFTQDDLDGCVQDIRDSISAMKTYLRDPGLNAPVDKAGFSLRSDTTVCRFCNFYELDRDEIASAQDGPF